MEPNEYWERDSISRDQKFYISFCILASACSDYAAGTELRLRKKLNWACTVLCRTVVYSKTPAFYVFPLRESNRGPPTAYFLTMCMWGSVISLGGSLSAMTP